MKAIIRLEVPEHQIGEEVSCYFKDTMSVNSICEKAEESEWEHDHDTLKAYDKGFDDGLEEGLKVGACEDCISRQYLVEKAVSWDKHFADGIRYVALTDILNAPPVTPAEKVGRWEYIQYDGNPNIGNWHCSECNRIVCGAITAVNPVYSYKYCPECGAKMREVES